MIVLSGLSWNYENKFSSLYKKEELLYTSLKEIHNTFISKEIIDRKINNYRRISENSKLYSLLTGLAFHDAGVKIDSEIENTGIISCTYNGTILENEKYFKDYVSAGRTMARGNLFVYTLPTSSLGEVAISFCLKGPLFHSTFSEVELEMFLDQADFMLSTNQTENLICIFRDKQTAICMFFTQKAIDDSSNNLTLESIKKELTKDISAIDFVEKIQGLC
jgi:hypothetical protein